MKAKFAAALTIIRQWWQSPWSPLKAMQLLSVIFLVVSVGMMVWFGMQTIWLGWQANRAKQEYRQQVASLEKTVQEYVAARQEFTDVTPEDSQSARQLFRALKDLYASPQVVEIAESTIPLQGVAFLQYDPNIKRTFLFSRIENLVKLSQSIPVIWLGKPAQGTQPHMTIPLGIPEVRVESNRPVGYFVYSAEGDVRKEFSQIIISYEATVSATMQLRPSAVLLEATW